MQIEAELCVDLQAHLDDPKFGDLIKAALVPGDHSVSHQLGAQLIKRGVQAILYPSAVPGHTGTNIVCILDSDPRPIVKVKNYADVLKLLKKAGAKSTRIK